MDDAVFLLILNDESKHCRGLFVYYDSKTRFDRNFDPIKAGWKIIK